MHAQCEVHNVPSGIPAIRFSLHTYSRSLRTEIHHVAVAVVMIVDGWAAPCLINRHTGEAPQCSVLHASNGAGGITTHMIALREGAAGLCSNSAERGRGFVERQPD